MFRAHVAWTFGLCLIACAADARSYRPFLIPTARAPESGYCRFESETSFPLQRRDPEALYSYSIGTACNVLSGAGFDVEAGFDWREAWDMRADAFGDPFQGFARVTYGAAKASDAGDGWSASLGMDDLGFAAQKTDFDVGYVAVENHTGPYEFEVGGYLGNDTLRAAGGSDASGAMFGLRRRWSRGELGLEWRSGRNRDGYGVVGVRSLFSETFAASLGYAIANDRDNMRDWLLVRLVLSQ